jgi:hypothetical protein
MRVVEALTLRFFLVVLVVALGSFSSADDVSEPSGASLSLLFMPALVENRTGALETLFPKREGARDDLDKPLSLPRLFCVAFGTSSSTDDNSELAGDSLGLLITPGFVHGAGIFEAPTSTLDDRGWIRDLPVVCAFI